MTIYLKPNRKRLAKRALTRGAGFAGIGSCRLNIVRQFLVSAAHHLTTPFWQTQIGALICLNNVFAIRR